MPQSTTRRRFLRLAALVGVPAAPRLLLDPLFASLHPGTDDEPPFAGATFERNIPFVDDEEYVLDRPYGRGLNGRLLTDLSRLQPDEMLTPNDRFYIRTRTPDRIDYSQPWMIRVHGAGVAEREVPVEAVVEMAEPRGIHVMECSGNYGCFGMLSAAEWTGVPLTDLLERRSVVPDEGRILVRGFDQHSRTPPNSTAGASWIFTVDQLRSTGAFLATQMNGEELPRDHGYPVRLVVPGWYGCTCIKWVNRIESVADDVPATDHMREFASRTNQPRRARLASQFRPATIDLAAMPVRIEQCRSDGRPRYRIVGIMWGGNRTTDKLTIRCNRDEASVPVEQYEHRDTDTWTLWSHRWSPTHAGRYRIQLHVDDPQIRTRRLDRGYYSRTVELTEV